MAYFRNVMLNVDDFDSVEEYKRALVEQKYIDKINTNTNIVNPEIAKSLYEGFSKHPEMFRTVVGKEFMSVLKQNAESLLNQKTEKIEPVINMAEFKEALLPPGSYEEESEVEEESNLEENQEVEEEPNPEEVQEVEEELNLEEIEEVEEEPNPEENQEVEEEPNLEEVQEVEEELNLEEIEEVEEEPNPEEVQEVEEEPNINENQELDEKSEPKQQMESGANPKSENKAMNKTSNEVSDKSALKAVFILYPVICAAFPMAGAIIAGIMALSFFIAVWLQYCNINLKINDSLKCLLCIILFPIGLILSVIGIMKKIRYVVSNFKLIKYGFLMYLLPVVYWANMCMFMPDSKVSILPGLMQRFTCENAWGRFAVIADVLIVLGIIIYFSYKIFLNTIKCIDVNIKKGLPEKQAVIMFFELPIVILCMFKELIDGNILFDLK